MAKSRGMWFYFDWISIFEMLPEAEVGKLVMAMLNYFESGKEFPKFENDTSELVARVVAPQLRRAKQKAEAGRKGGLASAAERKKSGKSGKSSKSRSG